MMRFLLLSIFLVTTSFISYGQPQPEYEYANRYAHPHKSNFSAQFKFGFAGLSGSNCTLRDYKDQNYFLNPRISLGLGYQYTHYINFLFRTSYFRYSCEPANADHGIRGKNWDSFVGVKHYLFPVRDYDNYLRRYNFYGMLGIGAMYMSPKDALTNEPLYNSRNFNRWAYMVPVAVGAQMKLSEFFLMDLEFSYYMTGAEYMDGLPMQSLTEGQGKDNFLSLGVNVIFQIPNKGFVYDKFLRHKNREDKL